MKVVHVDREDLSYYQGYFDAFRLVRRFVEFAENIYLDPNGAGAAQQFKALNDLFKNMHMELGRFEQGMFTMLKERYGDRLKYDKTMESYYVEAEKGEALEIGGGSNGQN